MKNEIDQNCACDLCGLAKKQEKNGAIAVASNFAVVLGGIFIPKTTGLMWFCARGLMILFLFKDSANSREKYARGEIKSKEKKVCGEPEKGGDTESHLPFRYKWQP